MNLINSLNPIENTNYEAVNGEIIIPYMIHTEFNFQIYKYKINKLRFSINLNLSLLIFIMLIQIKEGSFFDY